MPYIKKMTADADGGNVFSLPAVMDIGNAVPLHEEMKNHIASLNGDLILEASAVERVTTPAVQLIISACHAAGKAEHGCSIRNPSAAMQQSFSDLGLAETLQKLSR